MSRFIFPIDTKSLYLGIENDNEKGHTATVSTNLKQGSTVKPELALFQNSLSNIPLFQEDSAVYQCLKNSKAKCRITNILIFDKVYVNGTKIDTKGSSFSIFLKQETDESKYHFGRIKAHYPIGLSFESKDYSVSNRIVLTAIKEFLGGFAFIVRGFEIHDDHRIDFIVSIVGQNNINYSKVFLNYKGNAANKFTKVFNEQADTYDFEIISMRRDGIPGIPDINPQTYPLALEYCEKKAKQICKKQLELQFPSAEIYCLSDDYPYALYDFEIRDGAQILYIIMNFTTTRLRYFYLSSDQYQFTGNFNQQGYLLLVTDLLTEKPCIVTYGFDEIENLNRSVSMIKFAQNE